SRLAFAAALLVGAPAAGQESTPLDRFDPAPAGDAFFSVPSAGVFGRLRPAAATTLTYASEPLRLRSEREGAAADIAWVDRQVVLHVLTSLELFRTLKLDLDMPLTLDQGGDSGTLSGRDIQSPSGAAAGDLRLGARLALVSQRGLWPAAALRLSTWLPTGDDGAFSGAPTARFAPALVFGARYRGWVWSGTLGGRFQPTSDESLTGSETFAGLAVAMRLGPLQIGPELLASAAAGDPSPDLVRSSFSAEALLGARYTLGPLHVGAGGGPGFGSAPGTPSFRLFASLGVAADLLPGPREDDRDRDRDPGASRDTLAARRPSKPPPPPAPPDADGDGIADARDACPALVGVDTPPKPGCPPDQDTDGIYDVDDRCPAEAGVASADPARHGCPADTDGDLIVDAKDACPAEKGEATDDPKTNGCPRAVRVEGSQIVILQQVNFATGKADILPVSDDLLRQVASALQDHPEIARVAVDGHTDSRGNPRSNLDLSRRRALAVVQWLTEHGVDARRLEARGFGPRRPIADNVTEAGRAKNRRVEFQIRRRTPEGEAGWRDGPIDE
ncbi:MAG TPA: OmpA family protein, partial [Candidatus Nanopelagicales bacterium]|nr:OmpA family protein [Candidatus Nanopelagicales bacterium]